MNTIWRLRTYMLAAAATAWTLLRFVAGLSHARGAGRHVAAENSRGDVPGWVLITLMSAVLVAGLLAIAGPALERLFTEAMEQVRP